MSALQELKSSKAGLQGKIDWVLLGPFFWKWFHEHENDLILKRKILIFSVTIKVKDLRVLFEQLFGPEPASTAFVE